MPANDVISIPASSTEFLYLDGLRAFGANSTDPEDPTSFPIQFAFGQPTSRPPVNWNDGAWVSWDAQNGASARYLFSATRLGLALGRYGIWVKVTASSEVPIRQVGVLEVTAAFPPGG